MIFTKATGLLTNKEFIQNNAFKLRQTELDKVPEVQPWHTCLQIDDKCIVYVWDTREIEAVIDMDKIKDIPRLAKVLDTGLPLLVTNNEIEVELSKLTLS